MEAQQKNLKKPATGVRKLVHQDRIYSKVDYLAFNRPIPISEEWGLPDELKKEEVSRLYAESYGMPSVGRPWRKHNTIKLRTFHSMEKTESRIDSLASPQERWDNITANAGADKIQAEITHMWQNAAGATHEDMTIALESVGTRRPAVPHPRYENPEAVIGPVGDAKRLGKPRDNVPEVYEGVRTAGGYYVRPDTERHRKCFSYAPKNFGSEDWNVLGMTDKPRDLTSGYGPGPGGKLPAAPSVHERPQLKGEIDNRFNGAAGNCRQATSPKMRQMLQGMQESQPAATSRWSFSSSKQPSQAVTPR